MKTLSDNLLEAITRRLVEELQPEAIYLFGSHAWGTPDDESDLDLLIVLSNSDASLALTEMRARRALRDLRVPKDLLVRWREDVEQLSRVPASLEREILERGRVLYGRGQTRTGSQLAGQSAA